MGLLAVGYLIAGLLFILSIGGLAQQSTARLGNRMGVLGMVVAVVLTLTHPDAGGVLPVFGALALGGSAGLFAARRVEMTKMPELVAMLHAFVGLSAVLVGLSTYLDAEGSGHHGALHAFEVFVDVAIGGVTLSGSVFAWAKLSGRVSGNPTLLPGRHALNLTLLGALAVLAIPVTFWAGSFAPLLLAAFLAVVLGVTLVMPIGGADMPVVVSMLNSYSGWTAAAAGFMLSNDLLIITGALVGSSGAILSAIMCKAMNRSLWSVILGGFGTSSGTPTKVGDVDRGEVRQLDIHGFSDVVFDAKDVIIIPGYGMAVARAQSAVHDLVQMLQKRGARVRFAIHPVAGRLPGHMNVLLAEADVPYDLVFELEDIDHDLATCDLAIVVGANDTVNPAAVEDADSPIYGMPVLRAWDAKTCIVIKRSLSPGYAGIDNPLFWRDNTAMVFGDAREVIEGVVRGSTRAA